MPPDPFSTLHVNVKLWSSTPPLPPNSILYESPAECQFIILAVAMLAREAVQLEPGEKISFIQNDIFKALQTHYKS